MALPLAALIGGTAALLLSVFYAERDRIPERWNPLAALNPADPVTPFAGLKLARAVSSPTACMAALDRGGVGYARRDDFRRGPGCGIDGAVELAQLSFATLRPVATSCATALRLAMWERHTVQPAALAHLGSQVVGVSHLESYACRPKRTQAGIGTEMSAHASGDAIDITAVRLADGRELRLAEGWDKAGPEADFWHEVRDGACRWFGAVLSPDYNSLHRDHFHFSDEASGFCR